MVTHSDWESIATAAKNLSESIKADGIIAITRTGDTANYISNAKPNGIPIFTFTNNLITLNQLSLVGSTHSFFISRLNDHEKTLSHVKKELKKYFNKKKNLKFVMLSEYFLKNTQKRFRLLIFKLIF